VEEEGVPGLVVRVGYRPTGSSKARKPPPGGTNPSTRKHKAKGELKGNQKQKYRPIGQNFKQTQPPASKPHPLEGARLVMWCHANGERLGTLQT